MALISLDRDLWVADHPLSLAGLKLGTRTTLVRLAGGGLFVHSPGPLSGGLRAGIEKLGPVVALVAPNTLHHLFLAENAAAFPEAAIWVAPGVAEKQPGVSISGVLGDEAPREWADDLDQLVVQGIPRANEVVFLHRASRTLMLTDVAFNLRHSDSFFTRVFMRLNGGYGRFGPTRMMRRWIADPSALRASIDRILEWDFDRVTVTHGEVLETGGPAALRAAFIV